MISSPLGLGWLGWLGVKEKTGDFSPVRIYQYSLTTNSVSGNSLAKELRLKEAISFSVEVMLR